MILFICVGVYLFIGLLVSMGGIVSKAIFNQQIKGVSTNVLLFTKVLIVITWLPLVVIGSVINLTKEK